MTAWPSSTSTCENHERLPRDSRPRAHMAARDIRKKKVGPMSDQTQRARKGQIEDAAHAAELPDVLHQESDRPHCQTTTSSAAPASSPSPPTIEKLDDAVSQ